MNSLFHYITSFQCSSSNSWFIANSTAKKVRTAWIFGGYFFRVQQFQMNRYILHWFLKRLFWYTLNLYGKLHLLVWKFLQKGHWKGPKKGLKNVDCANWENIPIFSKWIDRLCAPQYSKIYRFIWRRMCVITHSFLKSVRFWRI